MDELKLVKTRARDGLRVQVEGDTPGVFWASNGDVMAYGGLCAGSYVGFVQNTGAGWKMLWFEYSEIAHTHERSVSSREAGIHELLQVLGICWRYREAFEATDNYGRSGFFEGLRHFLPARMAA